MKTTINIKNFRVFDESGVSFDLSPITILTGGNSSGKSTVVKALLLLQDFCQQLKADYDEGRTISLGKYKMDFHKEPNNILGSFDLVRHQGDDEDSVKSDSEKYITIEMKMYSYWLLQDVILHLEFGTIETDDLNNGYLHAYSILTLGNKVLYKAVRGGNASKDFTSVKNNLLQFLYGQHAISLWQNEITSLRVCEYGWDPDESIFEDFKKAINEMDDDDAIHLLEWHVSHFESRYSNKSIIETLTSKKIGSSFINNSPLLNVWCFFPCLEKFKDMTKSEIIDSIHELEKNYSEGENEKPSTKKNRHEYIEELLDLFEKSDASTLHDFISQKEDELLFKKEVIKYVGKSFCYPSSIDYLDEVKGQSNLIRISEALNAKVNDPQWERILYGMTLINKMTGSNELYQESEDIFSYSWHTMEIVLDGCLVRMIDDLFYQIIPENISYSSTTVVRQQRLYSLEDNSDFSKTLKSFFEIKRSYNEAKTSYYRYPDFWSKMNLQPNKYEPGSFMNKWVKQLNIADHVELKSHAEGYGVSIILHKNENNNKGMLLAEKGVGVTQVFTLLLKIENAIINSLYNILKHPLYTDGMHKDLFQYFSTYNQLHPITVALEEPECHLHPMYQSLLADMLNEAYREYNVHFIVETHSEYLIRKAQVLVAQHKYESEEELNEDNPFKVYYIPNDTEPYEMAFNIDGRFKNEFGKGFFDEASNLAFEIL